MQKDQHMKFKMIKPVDLRWLSPPCGHLSKRKADYFIFSIITNCLKNILYFDNEFKNPLIMFSVSFVSDCSLITQFPH